MVLLLILVFLTSPCIITFLPVQAESRTIVVPDDYPTIAAAIGNATDGDIVFVNAGIYNTLNETLQIDKSIQFIGEDRDTTIIDGNHAGNIIEITADNVEISGFTIQNSGSNESMNSLSDTGINVKTSSGSKITNNIIKNNIGGLIIEDCSNILISENKIQSNFHTPNIFISYSSTVTFSKNYVAGNTGETIVIIHCSDSIVTENQIVTNGFGMTPGPGIAYHGVIISNSQGITVSLNNITGNGQGLGLIESHGINVFRNNVRNNVVGISLSTGTTDNLIYENNIEANSNGMFLVESERNHDNRVYHNNFTSNAVQIYFYSSAFSSSPAVNIWDNGTEGNYWSDYAGSDGDGDGIGDSPYIINANNTDRYPFMAPFNGSIVISPKLSPSPSPTPTPPPASTPTTTPTPTPMSSALPSPSSSSSPQEQRSASKPEQQPETFPTALVAAASGVSIATVGVGVLAYFRKRER